MKIRYIAAIILLLTSINTVAGPICRLEGEHNPDLPYLIKNADAIVILRVERHISDFYIMTTLYSTHECYIYQTLKGDIPKNSRINLQLYNIEGGVFPYRLWSTHLIFLVKKAQENEPTDYRMFTVCGAQTLLKPSGYEKMPEGETIEEQVKNLVKDAIDYQTKEYQKRLKYLKSVIGQSEEDEQSLYDYK